MNNERRLSRHAPKHHCISRNFSCRLSAEVASHDVQTQIEACRQLLDYREAVAAGE